MSLLANLEVEFVDVEELEAGLFCFSDETRSNVFIHHLKTDQQRERAFFTLAERDRNDVLASAIINAAIEVGPQFQKICCAEHQEIKPFSHLLFVPPHYHHQLEDRLEFRRRDVCWCVPMYRNEFSGTESKEEFDKLQKMIPLLKWNRKPVPKVLIQFDNPRTQGGTYGNRHVAFSLEDALLELEEINGCPEGFIDIKNWKGERCRIVSPTSDSFSIQVTTSEVRKMTLRQAKVWVKSFVSSAE